MSKDKCWKEGQQERVVTQARGEISLGKDGQTTTRKTAESTKGENTKAKAVTTTVEQLFHYPTNEAGGGGVS